MPSAKPVSIYEYDRRNNDEEMAVQFVKELYQEGEFSKFRESGGDNFHWKRLEEEYWGRHRNVRNYKKQSPRENIMFRVIREQHEIMHDKAPIPVYSPTGYQNAESTELSFIQTNYHQQGLRKSNYIQNWKRGLYYFSLRGTRFDRLWWNPDLNGGAGNSVFSTRDPYWMVMAPSATSHRDALYMGEKNWVDMDILFTLFPGKIDIIKKFVGIESYEAGSAPQNENSFGQGTNRTRQSDRLGTSDEQDKEQRKVALTEMFYQVIDPRIELGLEEFDEGAMREFEKATDNGDFQVKVLVTLGDQVLLSEDPNGDPLIFDHGKIPYVVSQSNVNPISPYGISDLEVIESLVQELDRYTDRRAAHNERAMYPYLMIPTATQLKKHSFVQYPGVTIPYQGGERPWFLEQPTVGRDVRPRRAEILQIIPDLLGSGKFRPEDLKQNITNALVLRVSKSLEAPIKLKLDVGIRGPFEDLLFMDLSNRRQFAVKGEMLTFYENEQPIEFEASPEMIRTMNPLREDLQLENLTEGFLDKNTDMINKSETAVLVDQHPEWPVSVKQMFYQNANIAGTPEAVSQWTDEAEFKRLKLQHDSLQLRSNMVQFSQIIQQGGQPPPEQEGQESEISDEEIKNILASGNEEAILELINSNPRAEELALDARDATAA